MSIDAKKISEDFPILKKEFNGHKLTYFDNGATTQKPRQVVEAITNYYYNENANVGRSVYSLSMTATMAYERARHTFQKFINAKSPGEIVFTRGATESINLVVETYGQMNFKKGDEIVVSEMEHHANLCPWQKICDDIGMTLKLITVKDDGDIDMDQYKSLLNSKTKMVAITHVSNVLGTINPIKAVIDEAHKKNIPVLIDGAQGIAHCKVDVQELDCDFYCISGHKMYGPMGIGVLYGKEALLNSMVPYQRGGGIVWDVSFEKVEKYKDAPYKFEAGTPNVGGAIGLEAAANYLMALGMDNVYKYEHELTEYAVEKLKTIDGIKLYGNAKEKSGIISFLIKDLHPYDVGNHLNAFGIAVRTGVHCSIPYVDKLGLIGTVRASLGIYNTKEEVDKMIEALKSVKAGEWTLEKANSRM